MVFCDLDFTLDVYLKDKRGILCLYQSILIWVQIMVELIAN